MPPHVSKTAATAYASLVDGDGAQSILISGESGAGKTETTKIAMACLTAISGSSGKTAEAALESGIVLETFGNAKTVFNNNSSRFGKWCAVHFDARQATAARVESACSRSRASSAPPPAGKYHLFYQLLAGATAEERTAYCCAPTRRRTGTQPRRRRSRWRGSTTPPSGRGRRRGSPRSASARRRRRSSSRFMRVLAAGDLAFKEGAGGNNAARVITDRTPSRRGAAAPGRRGRLGRS